MNYNLWKILRTQQQNQKATMLFKNSLTHSEDKLIDTKRS